ncbi:uncharacterized protein DUF4157 [Nitrosomonas oligotropha]|uniref:Uncharacterized protein DUF4157 n=1 Tax=Nitrosomonas oligotropha TaxID=42354 RepID=A0A2T5I4M0_9PROT|nr:DUF4157 domain-containing protein [Nitrosomonas oligotropha]PTQ78763.1 uncharacterized protein DUF4157 [Nitrosomonas oligotropha]
MKRSLSIESDQQQAHRVVAAASSSANQVFSDNRKSATAQRQLMTAMTNSPQAIAQRKISQLMNNNPQLLAQRKMLSGEPAQRVEEEEPLQKKSKSIQRVEEEELQKKAATDSPTQLREQSSTQTNNTANNTGLPDNLKSGIESLSGMSMDSVRVHYNSSQPAQLNALAYAQGTDIHVAPGQEQHLPHEAWHVVQQAQGRVQPTMQMKEGISINDNRGLEHEADVMGAKASRMPLTVSQTTRIDSIKNSIPLLQLKPNDIDATYPINIGLDGKSTNPKGTRKNTSHASAINKLVEKSTVSPAVELIGGHLHKREYGGEDNDQNVVPWSATCESSYSTDFEQKYEAKFDAHKGSALTFIAKAKFANKDLGLTGSAEWENEQDKEIPSRKKILLEKKLDPIREVLERIPTEVETSCADVDFKKSGTDIAPVYVLPKEAKDVLLETVDKSYGFVHRDKADTHKHKR